MKNDEQKPQAGASKSYLFDMDGVIIAGNTVIPGAAEFIHGLGKRGIRYLILTNNPTYTPSDLHHRLKTLGLDIPAEYFYTSAMATAHFLNAQRPRGTAFVIGESGLTSALHQIGYVLTDQAPDYVVLGESSSFSYDKITQAVRLVAAGARFVATNPDVNGPGQGGIEPACGAIAAVIEKAAGVKPYFVGKPNPLMMRNALRYLRDHSENTVMVGDRMDTDIVAGIESGMDTILVLTGVTRREEVERFPYRPARIVQSIADIEV